MQPAQAGSSGSGGSGGNRQLKRWGPIIGVVAVLAIGAGVLVATSGDDDEDASDTTTAITTVTTAPPVATDAPVDTTGTTDGSDGTDPTATDPADTEPDGTTAPAEITFPMSWSQAADAGLTDQVEWGDRCDTELGTLAVPDFFAPACYAPFTGDNGGATSQGVTADEITLVAYAGQEGDPIIQYITDAIAVDDTNVQEFDSLQHIMRYYETYFELYGRKVNLITYEGTGGASDEVAARADAARIAEEYKPFAVFAGPALTSAFADELSARGIISIGGTPGQPAQYYIDHDPFLWGLDGSAVQKQTHVIEFITKQLVGKNATHAGDSFVDSPRNFGLVYLESSGASKELADGFAASMEAAGAPLAEQIPYALDPSTIQATASQTISKLKSAGVTTVILSGDPVAPRDFTKEATAQEYFPEWIVAASTLMDTNAFARTYDQEQWQHAFGVTSLAAKTDATVIGYYHLYEWFNGEPPPAEDSIGVYQPNPALFFATAQAVGPNLTPETFRDALFAADGTKASITNPYLSYGDKGYWPEADYLGIDDATVFWWDVDATGPDEIRKEGTGMYEFVDGGKRYLPGEWPSVDKLFDPEGAITIYTEPPAAEVPPDYPSPAGG